MQGEGVFPYDLIKKHKKVIIYGMGNYGKSYIEQIEKTQYCQIVAVSDINNNVSCNGYNYIEPSYIPFVVFDYIIIAIKSIELSTEVYWKFVRMGIEEKHIVSEYMNEQHFFPCFIPSDITMLNNIDMPIEIAITLDGGLGDHIIALALYRKLIELAPNCIVDIYGKKNFIKVIYGNERNVRDIYEFSMGVGEINRFKRKYDLALRWLFFINVEFVNYYKIKANYPLLNEKILETKNSNLISDLKYGLNSYLFVHQRAYKMGYDRYRFLGLGHVWDINSNDARLQLNPAYLNEYERLDLGRYITFNCGASIVPGQDGKKQTKVWPIEYFHIFVKEFKRIYPNIKVVQLGDDHATVIEDTDVIMINASLELVKYILVNSMIHVDCEGGLVHLATQLGVKCVVIFGPTPAWFYQYISNININSDACGNCCHIKADWYTKCLLGDQYPRCMRSVKPEAVLENVVRFINELS